MACAYTERVVLSQQLITCSRELAGLAQRAAELFADLGESVSAIDSTLGRLSGRVVDLDRKISEAKAAHDAQTPAPGPNLGPHCVPLPPLRRHLSTIAEAPLSESLFAPSSRPLKERLLYNAVEPQAAPVPQCFPVVYRRRKPPPQQAQSSEESGGDMKRLHHPSTDSLVSEKSTATATSRRSSWRESFRLPIKRRRRQTAERPRSVDFAHRHTIACLPPDPPDSVHHHAQSFAPPPPPAPPSQFASFFSSKYPSTTPSSSSLMEYEPQPQPQPYDNRRPMTYNEGVRRHHTKSTGEMPYGFDQQLPLDERVISALVERTLHLSGHLDHGLHRPQSSHLSVDAASSSASGAAAAAALFPVGPSERSQSCNGLLEERTPRGSASSAASVPHHPPVPAPPPRNGSLMRASSMPMSPQMMANGKAGGAGSAGCGVDPAAVSSKLKRSLSISQRARALFRPVSARRSRSRSKEGQLNEDTAPQRHSATVVGFDLSNCQQESSAAATGGSKNALSVEVGDGTGSVERRGRKGRGRSKSPISWLLSRIHPPGHAAHLHPHQRPPSAHQQQTRAFSCMEPAFTVMPIEVDDVFDRTQQQPDPSHQTAAAAHPSGSSIFRRRSRSREKSSPKKAVHAVAAGLRLAGLYRPGSRSPSSVHANGGAGGGGDNAEPTFHRYRTDSDEVDFYVRRHVIDFPSDDADDFHVNFSRLTSLHLHRQALLESIHPQSVAAPVASIGIDQVRHCLHSGRDITRRGRHRHSRRYADRYSADTAPSTSGGTNSGDWSSSAEPTPPSPGIVRMQAVRPSSLFFHAPNSHQPPLAGATAAPGAVLPGPTSPRLRPVTPGLIGGGISGVGSLAEQLDKLSSQFCNAVSLRKGYKGSGSRSSSGHWSVSTSSLHPKRSSYMSGVVGQPTSPVSAGSQPGHPLARSVSKDSALDSSSPCERPSSELVNVAAMRSVEVQTEVGKAKQAAAALVGSLADMAPHKCLPEECTEDDVFCRSSAETLSSLPPEPPPRSASLMRGREDFHHTNPIYVDTDHDMRSPSTGPSRPGTPGRLDVSSGRQLPVALPYRSGTLPRNLQARLKSGADTLKRLEVNYRPADDEAHDDDSDSDSDSASGTGQHSSSGSEPPAPEPAPPTSEVAVKAAAAAAAVAVSMRHQYAVIDLDQCSPLPSPTLAPASLSGKIAGVGGRSPHLSSNSHLSSFSGDSDTGSSCSSANPYHRLYSLSAGAGNRAGGAAGTTSGETAAAGGSGGGTGSSSGGGGGGGDSGDRTATGFAHRAGFRFSKGRRFLGPNPFAADTA